MTSLLRFLTYFSYYRYKKASSFSGGIKLSKSFAELKSFSAVNTYFKFFFANPLAIISRIIKSMNSGFDARLSYSSYSLVIFTWQISLYKSIDSDSWSSTSSHKLEKLIGLPSHSILGLSDKTYLANLYIVIAD
jgi:hypothetical protein